MGTPRSEKPIRERNIPKVKWNGVFNWEITRMSTRSFLLLQACIYSYVTFLCSQCIFFPIVAWFPNIKCSHICSVCVHMYLIGGHIFLALSLVSLSFCHLLFMESIVQCGLSDLVVPSGGTCPPWAWYLDSNPLLSSTACWARTRFDPWAALESCSLTLWPRIINIIEVGHADDVCAEFVSVVIHP